MAAIDGVLRMAAENEFTLDHRTIPLAEVADTWADDGRRIVYMPA